VELERPRGIIFQQDQRLLGQKGAAGSGHTYGDDFVLVRAAYYLDSLSLAAALGQVKNAHLAGSHRTLYWKPGPKETKHGQSVPTCQRASRDLVAMDFIKPALIQAMREAICQLMTADHIFPGCSRQAFLIGAMEIRCARAGAPYFEDGRSRRLSDPCLTNSSRPGERLAMFSATASGTYSGHGDRIIRQVTGRRRASRLGRVVIRATDSLGAVGVVVRFLRGQSTSCESLMG